MNDSMQGGGLHLPEDVGVGETAAAAIESRWDTIQSVDEYLVKQGMLPNSIPECTCPPVTAELLSTTNTAQYTTLFASQLRWKNYAGRLLADIRAHLLQINNEMSDIETDRRITFRKMNETKAKSDRISSDEMVDRINIEPRYRELKIQGQQMQQLRLKLEAWDEELDRNMKTISRQIEVRKTEFTGGTRESNMPGHASGRWDGNGPRHSGT